MSSVVLGQKTVCGFLPQTLIIMIQVHEGIHILRMSVFADKSFALALARKGTSLLVSHIQEW